MLTQIKNCIDKTCVQHKLGPTVFQVMIYDHFENGMTFDTIGSGDFSMSTIIIMLLIDAILYLLIAFYLDNVLPGMFFIL